MVFFIEFCSNEKTGVKGECLSNAICEQNDPVYNGVCEAVSR